MTILALGISVPSTPRRARWQFCLLKPCRCLLAQVSVTVVTSLSVSRRAGTSFPLILMLVVGHRPFSWVLLVTPVAWLLMATGVRRFPVAGWPGCAAGTASYCGTRCWYRFLLWHSASSCPCRPQQRHSFPRGLGGTAHPPRLWWLPLSLMLSGVLLERLPWLVMLSGVGHAVWGRSCCLRSVMLSGVGRAVWGRSCCLGSVMLSWLVMLSGVGHAVWWSVYRRLSVSAVRLAIWPSSRVMASLLGRSAAFQWRQRQGCLRASTAAPLSSLPRRCLSTSP